MCGIFGAWNIPDAVSSAFIALHFLQHRGQESAGIATLDSGKILLEKGMGIIADNAIPLEKLVQLKGTAVIGQVRYSTVGNPAIEEAQPFLFQRPGTEERIALVHNGQLNGLADWQKSASDSERFGVEYGKSQGTTIEEKVFSMLDAVTDQGSYALQMLVQHPTQGAAFVAAKDQHGNRPLAMAQTDGGGYLFASETSALQAIHTSLYPIRDIRELEPGEIIIISERDGFRSSLDGGSHERLRPVTPLPCFFEAVYFAHPDSLVFGHPVSTIREALGRELAREHPCDVDIVVSVPDSANNLALGFSQTSGIPLEYAITRSHYITRTFIDPNKPIRLMGYSGKRDLSLAFKFSYNPHLIDGKRIVLLDDSIVRGSTMQKIVGALYRNGAKEVHLRIGCPPIISPCYYGGMNTPSYKELVADGRTLEEIRLALGSSVSGQIRHPTSLAYLSHAATMRAIPFARDSRCDACVTGDYKMPRGE